MHIETKECKIKKVITDKYDCDMIAWMGLGSKFTLKSVESPLCILLRQEDFSIICEINGIVPI